MRLSLTVAVMSMGLLLSSCSTVYPSVAFGVWPVRHFVSSIPECADATVKPLFNSGVPEKAIEVRCDVGETSVEEFFALVEHFSSRREPVSLELRGVAEGVSLGWVGAPPFADTSQIARLVGPGVHSVTVAGSGILAQSVSVQMDGGNDGIDGADAVAQAAARFDEFVHSETELEHASLNVGHGDEALFWHSSMRPAPEVKSVPESLADLEGLKTSGQLGNYEIAGSRVWDGELKELTLRGPGVDEAVIRGLMETTLPVPSTLTILDTESGEKGWGVVGGKFPRPPGNDVAARLREIIEVP